MPASPSSAPDTASMPSPAAPARSIDRVTGALTAAGIEPRLKEYPASTRTAEDAASAIGCTVGQIIKSLIFKASDTARPVLALVSGDNRVDVEKLAAALGETIERADARWVRDVSGFAIGGVSPVGHLTPPVTFIDADLERKGELWAAAGNPNSVFAISFDDLRRVTGGRVVALA
ncbi:YbaK/EbsC family protein [Radicibacter daui]|uniref:YbaK/EbsC family protein n=1 Tax=Radicibacter daui TaxID=3064829 RepID=UPI004046C40F